MDNSVNNIYYLYLTSTQSNIFILFFLFIFIRKDYTYIIKTVTKAIQKRPIKLMGVVSLIAMSLVKAFPFFFMSRYFNDMCSDEIKSIYYQALAYYLKVYFCRE